MRRLLVGLAILATVGLVTPRAIIYWCHSRAQRAMSQTQLDRADLWLERAEVWSADDPESAFLQLRLARKRGDVAGFQHWLTRAQQRGVSRERIRRERLLAQVQRGAGDGGEAELSRLLVDPRGDAEEICEAYVNGFVRRYEFEQARALLDVWGRDFPESPRPHLMRGRIIEHLGDWEAAASEYRAALAVDPSFAAAAYNLARLQLAQNDVSGALASYETCAGLLDEPAPADVGRAACLRMNGRIDEARALLTGAASRDHARIERAFLALGESAESASNAVEAELGRLELAAGNADQALHWLEAAYAANPRDWEVEYSLGSALSQLGRSDEADKHFESVQQTKNALSESDRLIDALRKRPDDVAARRRLGEIFLAHVSESQGLVWLHSALRYDPHDPATHARLAEYYRQHADQHPDFAALAETHARQAAPLSPLPLSGDSSP